MRALLDVGVLLALFDRDHVQHTHAKQWFLKQSEDGWASCPLTQNGFVRIISQPKYPKPVKPLHAINLLKSAVSSPVHEFWPADISLLDRTRLDPDRLHGPRQITDLYLLALAVSKGGFLATLDEGIPLSAVPEAAGHHLVILR